MMYPNPVHPGTDVPPDSPTAGRKPEQTVPISDSFVGALRTSSADGAEIADAARLHGVQGLLYAHLARDRPAGMPDRVFQSLQQEARAIQLTNLQMMQELILLAQAFDDAGIPLLTVKGPLLAQRDYGNLALRRFGDVDVLVRPSDYPAALDLFDALGYAPRDGIEKEEARASRDAGLGRAFVHPDRGVTVELHDCLLNRSLSFRLSADRFWREAVRRPLGSTHVYELSPAHRLLYLCAHGTKHHWSRLLWVVDVAQVVRRHADLDWDALLGTARRIGSLRVLLLGLRLTQEWLDTDLPDAITEAVAADPMIDTLVDEIETVWFGTDKGIYREADWQTFWFTVRTRQRLRDNRSTILHYLRLAVTPTDNDRAFAGPAVPDSLLYLVRPVRLLADGLGLRSRPDGRRPERAVERSSHPRAADPNG